MKTVWEYSLETEALRILHCTHQMIIGFYRLNNFYVIPYGSKRSGAIVYIPNLPYNKIPRFWDKSRLIDIRTFPIKADKKVVKEVVKFLEKQNLPKPNFEETRKLWSLASAEIISTIEHLIPKAKGKIKEIIINPTITGTGVSFNLFDPAEGKIFIYLREGNGIHAISEAVITSLTRNTVYNELAGTWSESELLADWLITQSPLSEVLAKYEPCSTYLTTLKETRKPQKGKILAESENFYKKLGLPGQDKIFSLNGKTPEIYKKPVENLTETEKKLLQILIDSCDKVLSFDDIADMLFLNDNEFSLYAIAKAMQRLRNKLEQNGVSGSYIQTLRGRGYILKN